MSLTFEVSLVIQTEEDAEFIGADRVMICSDLESYIQELLEEVDLSVVSIEARETEEN